MKKSATLTLFAFVLVLTSGFAAAHEVMGLLPEQAYEYVKNYDNAYILDVRTPAEYYWIGHPATNLADDPDSEFLEGKVFHVPYLLWVYDKGSDEYVKVVNKKFARTVARMFPEGSILIFICRSGGRSADCQYHLLDPKNSNKKDHEKILTFEMYNLDEGFEGGRDPETRHRTLDAGWKNKGLPYQDGDDGIWPTDGDDEASDG